MLLIKLLILVAVVFLLLLPFLPFHWVFSFSHYAYPRVSRKRNLFNILVLIGLAVACVVFLPYLRAFSLWFGSLQPVQWVLARLPSYAFYSADLVVIIFINLLYCLAAFSVLLIIHGGQSLFDHIKTARERAVKKKKDLRKKLRENKEIEPEGDEYLDPEEADEKPFPEKLLPPPEDDYQDHRIVLSGTTTEKSEKAKSGEKKDVKSNRSKAGRRQKSSLFSAARSFFFEEKGEEWFSRPQTSHVSRHLRYFLILAGAAYVLSFLLLLIPVLFRATALEDWLYKPLQFFISVNYLYPTMALSVLVLLFYFFNGKPLRVETELDDETIEYKKPGRVVDLSKVEADLMKTCGRTCDVQSFYSKDVIKNSVDRNTVEYTNDDVLRSIAEYVDSEGLELNQEYLIGIKSFNEGKNVLFHAPMYTAIGVYLYAVLNLRLMQGERIVVICHNRSQIDNYIEQMNSGFLNLTRTHKPLWKIVSRDQLGKDAQEDILFLTPDDFRDDSLFVSARDFFSQVSVALLPDANLVVSANNYFCQIISQRLKHHCHRELQYVFLSTRTTLNLDNALTEYFLLDSKPVYARGDFGYGDVHIYIWRTKKDGVVLLDSASRTMPLEVCICDIANRNGITEPNLISDSAIYSNQINPHWLDIYDSAKRPLGFAIVADDNFNLPSVIFTYSRYIGKKISVLNVISRHYLLRNYFFAHAPRYLFEQPLLERSFVEHANSAKTDMILLLCRLMEGIPCDEFVSKMEKLGVGSDYDPKDFNSVSKLAELCLEKAIDRDLDHSQEHFSLYWPKSDFYPRQYIRINEDYDVLSHLMEDTRLVQIRFRGGNRAPTYIDLFRHMVDQRYLPGQNLVYANQNFEIKTIDRENGVIEVDDASAVHGLARDYVQLRKYQLEDMDLADECRRLSSSNSQKTGRFLSMRKQYIGEDNMVSSLYMLRSDQRAKIISDTYGYYLVYTDGRSLNVSDGSIQIIDLDDGVQQKLKREVVDAVYIRLELKRSRDDRLTMTLAALLQEMLKTLFPDCYFCLSVCPILEDPESIYQNPDYKSKAIAHLYPRLENWGEVCKDSVELLILDDCKGGTGALNLVFEPEGTFLQNAFWMLGDYLEWQKEYEPDPYIFFGMDEQPEIFDMDGVRAVMQTFVRNYVREYDIHSRIDGTNVCALCGGKISEPFLWHGNQNICEKCAEEYTPDSDEAALIVNYAREYLINTFSINLPAFDVSIGANLQSDMLSALDYSKKTIHFAEDLPLRVMHVQAILQLVIYWQMDNLDLTGDLVINGQRLYVTLQYLRYLKQYQYAHFLHREYLLGKDDNTSGYYSLLNALLSEGHENSFSYLLKLSKKSKSDPIKRYPKKSPTRVPRNAKPTYYYRSTLKNDDVAVYDALLDLYVKQEIKLDLEKYNLTEAQLETIHACVLRDHPEIFWTNGNYSYATSSKSGAVVSFTAIYAITREERDRAQKEIDDAIAPFLSEITDEMEDYEVAVKLYEKVIDYLDYDTIALERSKKMQRDQTDHSMDNLRNIYGAIVKHRSVCAGYAKAYQYLLQLFGMEALVVSGICAKGGPHAWTVVNMEGDYYHVDVTWGDQSNTDPSKDAEGISYAYFGLTDSQIRTSRSIDVNPVPPKCCSEGCNYLVRSGQYFTKLDPNALLSLLGDRFKDPDFVSVEIRFASIKLLKEAEYYLFRNGGVFEAIRLSGRENDTIYHSTNEELFIIKINLHN